MATTATNFYIAPQDGWVQISAAADFLRVSAVPHTHPFYVTFAASAPSLLPVAASGTVTIVTTGPTEGQIVTIGSEVYTFTATPTVPFDVDLGAGFADAADNLAITINADSILFRASEAGSVVTVTALNPGTQGNVLFTTNADDTTLTGAGLLTGGTDIALGALICHDPLFIDVTTDAACWARVPNPVSGSRHGDGTLRVDVIAVV